MQPVPVVVLAGGSTKPEAREQGWPEHRALVPVAGRPVIAWVLDALRACPAVRGIAVVGPDALESMLDGEDLLPVGETMWDNVYTGLNRLPSGPALICGSDIPLLTPESISDLVARGMALGADFVYPIVRREDNEAQCSGLSRTYATVAEGTYTGGNLMLVNGPALLRSDVVIRAALAARKKPLALVRLLKPSPVLVARVLLKRARVAELEQAVGRILGVRASALVTPYAEIGADLDRPEETPIMESLMRSRGLTA